MSYRFNATATQGLYLETALATAVPLWIATAFTNTLVLPYAGFPLIVTNGGGAATNDHRWTFGFSNTGNPTATSRTGVSATATGTAIFDGDTAWHVGVAGFISATSRLVEVDGAGTGTNTTSSTPTAASVDRFIIGNRPQLDATVVAGDIAYVAFGTGELSAGDRTLLAAGGDPRDISGGVLVELWDFTDTVSPLVGLIGGNTLIEGTGQVFVTDRPDYAWLAGNQVVPPDPAAVPIEVQHHALLPRARRQHEEEDMQAAARAHFNRIYGKIK